MTAARNAKHDVQAGFTLIEILVALAIGGVVLVLIGSTVISTLRRQQAVEKAVSSSSDGTRILALIERDLRALWHHNIRGNAVLMGRDMSSQGSASDRLDFLCTTDSVSGTLDVSNQIGYPSLCEVGYWIKPNPDQGDWNELWRREDPLVDNDLLSGGTFQLVSDRVKSLNLTYYETVGERAEEWSEWDSRAQGLPRRIKIELTIDRRVGNSNEVSQAEIADQEKVQRSYVRHVVFDRRLPEIMAPNVALMSMAPPPPVAGGPEGPVGPAGPGGPAGPAGAGGMPGLGDVQMTGGGQGRGGQGRGGQGQGRGGQGRGGQLPGGGGNQGPPINLGDLLRGMGGGGGGLPFGGGGDGR